MYMFNIDVFTFLTLTILQQIRLTFKYNNRFSENGYNIHKYI